jgi:hypothetical protein
MGAPLGARSPSPGRCTPRWRADALHAVLRQPARCDGAAVRVVPQDIGWLADRNPVITAARPSGTACASCHPDHAGKEFAWCSGPGAARAFRSRLMTGWPLEQKHAEARMQACHVTKYGLTAGESLRPKTGELHRHRDLQLS